MPSLLARLGLPLSSSSHSSQSHPQSSSSPPGRHSNDSTSRPSPTARFGQDRPSLGHLRSQSHNNIGGPSREGGVGRSGFVPLHGGAVGQRRMVGVRNSDGNLRGGEDSARRSANKGTDVLTVSGKCCCCESTVRWPSHLTVFRCCVCATINDLTVASKDKRSPPPTSIAQTKAIINSLREGFISSVKTLLDEEGSTTPSAALDEKLELEDSNVSLNTGNAEKSEPVKECHAVASSPSKKDKEKHVMRDPGLPLHPQPENFASPKTEEDLDSLQRKRIHDITTKAFKPLEDHIALSFASFECLNSSFKLEGDIHHLRHSRSRSLAPYMLSGMNIKRSDLQGHEDSNSKLDEQPKRQLAEGEYEEMLLRRTRRPSNAARTRNKSSEKVFLAQSKDGASLHHTVTLKSPAIDWSEVDQFYDMILNVGSGLWTEAIVELRHVYEEQQAEKDPYEKAARHDIDWDALEDELRSSIEAARTHTGRVMLKATETLLKRPGRPLRNPDDLRFLLIILANPLLYGPLKPFCPESPRQSARPMPQDSTSSSGQSLNSKGSKPTRQGSSASKNFFSHGPGQHSGIIKRLMGLLSSLPNEVHHYLVSWFARYPENKFRKLVELCGSFVTYRLTRQHGQNQRIGGGGLLGGTRGKGVVYNDDWQIRVSARVMALLFSANNNLTCRRDLSAAKSPEVLMGMSSNPALQARYEAHKRGQIVPTSDFYNSLLDYADLIADFDAWEGRGNKFSFCQYPFFLSMGAKIHILEYDARRQMELKAREAFFSSITNRRSVNQYLVLKVRRDCLVEDSLKGISQGVGSVDEIKKGLRIEFIGEDGVDAGGLRKEWFLLLVRDIFDPRNGMFVYDEDSRYCYFNPNSFESSEEFFLVGVLFGLAIYNSTILDVAFPPFVFKKLLHASGANSQGSNTFKPPLVHTLDDLAVFRPALASGLRQLLEFEGDVKETFCRDFVAEVERYGKITAVPLCPGGENRAVDNTNRREFVDLYIKYIIDTSVARQFEPFKRGFYTVCAGNALSLFRPEELELLIRGSAEPLDISSLRAVSITENWGVPHEKNHWVDWFWEYFARISPEEQRLLLGFITGSDRIPAVGATNLVIRIVCMGPDTERYPTARTCFNALCLYKYSTREKLERMLDTAVRESEGFGLK